MILSNAIIVTQKPFIITYFFLIFMEVFVICRSFTYLCTVFIAWANDQKYYVDFINIFIH